MCCSRFLKDFFIVKKIKMYLFKLSNLYWLFITLETLLKVFSFFSVFIISKLYKEGILNFLEQLLFRIYYGLSTNCYICGWDDLYIIIYRTRQTCFSNLLFIWKNHCMQSSRCWKDIQCFFWGQVYFMLNFDA